MPEPAHDRMRGIFSRRTFPTPGIVLTDAVGIDGVAMPHMERDRPVDLLERRSRILLRDRLR